MTGPLRLASAVLVAGVIAGCSGIPLPAGLAGPAIVEGTVVDGNGLPIAGARVRLSLIDAQDAQPIGPIARTLLDATTTTDAAGRFTFYGQPSVDLVEYAGVGGTVTLDVEAVAPRDGAVGRTQVERRLDGATWAGGPPRSDVTVEAPVS